VFHFLLFSGLVDRRPCFHSAFKEKKTNGMLLFFDHLNAGTNIKRRSSKRHYHCTFLPVLDRHHAPLLL
jgi:hypothetical protein